MTDRELKRLSRADLLELLLEQLKENEQLQTALDEARKQLDQRELKIENAGSIAEAALQLNGVFEAAQAACDQYMENVRQTEQRCAQMERETQRKCERMIADAKSQSQNYWDQVFRKVRELSNSYAELRAILQQAPRARD